MSHTCAFASSGLVLSCESVLQFVEPSRSAFEVALFGVASFGSSAPIVPIPPSRSARGGATRKHARECEATEAIGGLTARRRTRDQP